MGWFLFGLAIAVSALLWGAAALRARGLRPLREAAPRRRLEELGEGRFRVVGKIVPVEATPSEIDGLPCVFLEHVEYAPMSDVMRREREHSLVAHPFFVEDGTGRALVDPRGALVEAATVWGDGGLAVERRLRAGEEVEVVASFERVEIDEAGPYRGAGRCWAAAPGPWGPPRISYRTEADMVQPSDDVAAFLRAAGVFLATVTALLSALALL